MKNLFPQLSSSQARLKYEREAWLNFGRRITKNPFVKQFLISRDGNCCSWCKKRFIKGTNIHHISYDHSCSFHKTTRISRVTSVGRIRTSIIPDCQSCSIEQPMAFQNCISKLVIVHPVCNRLIYQKDKRL